MKKPRFLCSEFFLDIIFPNRCPACDSVIEWDRVFCAECENKLEYIEDRVWQSVFPHEIGGDDPCFDSAASLFWYKGTAKEAVLGLKYRKAKRFAKYAAEKISLKLETEEYDFYDIVTCVPMHKSKEKKRGYNQADLFAKEVSKNLNRQYLPDLLSHRRSNTEQHKLKASERTASADRTYLINEPSVSLKGKSILLCDDVFTTGSTLNKCARLLKEMGAEKVAAVTIVLVNNMNKE